MVPIKSQDNIADLGTRMDATERDIVEGSIWQRGTAWLREDMSCWLVLKNLDDITIPEY